MSAEKLNLFKWYIRAHDYQAAAEKVGVTVQTVRNALRKAEGENRMSEKEQACIEALIPLAKANKMRVEQMKKNMML